MQLQKAPNTTAFLNEKEYLFFSGTSYLGIPMLPEFQQLLIESIQNWGTSYGSSRNANLKLSIYQKAEEFLSGYLKTEDAVSVSSGTIAGQFALNAFSKIVDAFFFMPKTHPAILPNNTKPVFENEQVNSTLITLKNKTICIVVDAIASLETCPFSFDFLNSIDNSNKVYLLIDESHSLGVLGENGSGISSQIIKKENLEIVIVSSLGKAFGVNGGIVAGSKNFVNLVKSDVLFIGCAGMSPAFIEAFVNGQKVYQKQHKKLLENCTYVYEKIHHLKEVRISKNYPVFFFENEKIAEYLYEKEILITSFYYPAAAKKINRIVLNANHTKKQLDSLIDCLIQFKL